MTLLSSFSNFSVTPETAFCTEDVIPDQKPLFSLFESESEPALVSIASAALYASSMVCDSEVS